MDKFQTTPLVLISQHYEDVQDVIYSFVGVGKDGKISSGEAGVLRQVKALWDTGAMMTCISERLAKEMKLETQKFEIVATASGIEEDVPVYQAHLIFSAKTRFLNWEMVEFVTCGDDDADLIIGMDIIMQGDFALTNFGGRSVFFFRLPSFKTIDFEEELLSAE